MSNPAWARLRTESYAYSRLISACRAGAEWGNQPGTKGSRRAQAQGMKCMDGEIKPGENRGMLGGWRRIAAGMLLISGVAVLDQSALAQRGSFAAEDRGSSSSTPSTSSSVDAGKLLMRQAREAYNRNDFSRAKLLAEKAKEMRKPGQIWEDSPEKLIAEIDGKTRGKAPVAATPVARKSADPRVLLKEGRDALNAGKIETAQDLARQAEANQSSSSWGLFEDTPASLIRDVAKAKSKRDKAESARLLGEARKVFEKKTGNETERLANLEKAQVLATQAERLHGPYSFWEMGEKPSKLLSEIETNKARNRNSSALVKATPKPTEKSPIQTVSNTTPAASKESAVKTAVAMQKATSKSEVVQSDLKLPGLNNSVKTVSAEKNLTNDLVIPALPEMGTTKPTTVTKETGTAVPIVNPAEKDKAVALMAAARSLTAKGDLVGAKDKLTLAISLNAPFDAKEESPELAMQKLQSAGIKKMADLCNEASSAMLKQDLPTAETRLNSADALATTLGIDAGPVTEHRKALLAMKGQPVPDAVVETPKTTTVAGMPKMMPVGNQEAVARQSSDMLAAARAELRKGETENARRIVEEVMVRNVGNRSEAESLLRTIDAEELNQRTRTATRSFENGIAAYNAKDHRQALAVFQLIDPALLTPQKRSQLKDLMVASAAVLKQDVPAVAKVDPMGPIQQVAANDVKPMDVGTAKVNQGPADADNLIKQQQALQEIQFQKMRSEGLKVQTEATAKFGKGDTDSAMRELQNYMNRVKDSAIEPAKQALLTRPIENRLEQFRVMKKQQDFLTAEDKAKREFRDEMSQEALSDQHKKTEVAKMMRQFHDLFESKKYKEANLLAMKMRELDPDDPSTTAAVQLSRQADRVGRWNTLKDGKENWNYEAGNEAHDFGPPATMKNPLVVDPEMLRNGRRPDYSRGIGEMRTRTEREREIEMKLSKPVSLNFTNTPLKEVVTYFQTVQGLNVTMDTDAMKAANISPDLPVTEKLTDIQLRSALNIVLKKSHLTHIVEDDVLKITTEKGARGKLVTRTFPVADLVIPVQDALPSDSNNLTAILERQLQAKATINGVSPFAPPLGLNAGQGTKVGSASGLQGQKIESGNGIQITKSGSGQNLEATLIKLIKSTIKPDSWSDLDGPGTIDFYPLGFALVINQTPDVIEQVESLLQALRRLQDLEVAIEIRLVSLSESFYERIGIDFSMNIKTNTSSVEPNLTQGVNRPTPFVNDLNASGVTAGWSPTGFTNDLDIPIRASSFSFTNPAFGGFPNSLGANGGISLGLAFLNDIQVYMFMEAAQGDRRVNIMQAPRLTAFNGQSSSISIQDQQFFVLNMNALSVNGQVIFIPENTPVPLGVSMNIQPVVTADRRFVRMNVAQTMNNLTSATVPLYPVTTFITPVLEGGFIGQPIPFTNYLQQPSISSLTIQTTVIVPDGGTVLIGGMKTLSEGRNEFGPPVLSKIPYVNRLFKNVGYGREAQSLMMMITPRIIINAEEQERQTGVTAEGEEIP
jgi:type II secretory pathway component GspD/PulD (secretin)